MKFTSHIIASTLFAFALTVPLLGDDISTRVEHNAQVNMTAKTSDLIGMEVTNYEREKLGRVEDIVVDLWYGRVLTAVISNGGLLGLGKNLNAIPLTALRFTSDRSALLLDVSKAVFNQAPRFKANEWPDFTTTNYTEKVYRVYKFETYFNGGTKNAADDTNRNERDRTRQTLTSFDQGSYQTDIDTTAQIRKEIVATKSLSVNAKNIKIITRKSLVTLRGPVNSEEEKRLIAEIADRIALSPNVDNQLEVKR